MSSRIPSSLKWLIDKRARLDAEIRKTEAFLAKAKDLINELSNLKESLNAIDHTLSLYEIKVDINLIQRQDYNEVRPHSTCRRMPPAKYAALHRQQASNAIQTITESITLQQDFLPNDWYGYGGVRHPWMGNGNYMACMGMKCQNAVYQ